MNTVIDLDGVVIDGTKLREARTERGLSVAEVAVLCTLSREQVQHIEDGGVRPFYTPAHKLLAIRKYAAAMGIPYDDIVTGPGADDTMPVPADAPPSLMVHGEGEEATDLRLAAVERNAEIRRKILIGAVTLTIVLALYAKMRGTPDNDPEQMPPVASEAEITPADTTPERMAGGTSAVASSSGNAGTSNNANASTQAAPSTTAAMPAAPAAPAASAAEATTTVTPTAATAAPVESTMPAAVPAAKAAGAASAASPATSGSAPASTGADSKLASAESCANPVPGDLKTWTPTYQRKADTRLFVVSPKETTVCVHDASGKASLLKLKARAGQAYSGKPPYVVQSPQLSELEIYLQGMRARVPPQAPALRLQLSPVSAPPAPADAG